MAQRSRQLTALLLLYCFIAPIGLTYAVLKLRQYRVREDVEHQILQGFDKGELLELKFTLAEARSLEWEHEGEFEYNGQSYDVVNQEILGDSIVYYVWWDKIETQIKNQLAQLVAQALNQDEEQQENQEELIQLLKDIYYQTHFNTLSHFDNYVKSESRSYVQYYISPDWAPPVPPPISC